MGHGTGLTPKTPKDPKSPSVINENASVSSDWTTVVLLT